MRPASQSEPLAALKALLHDLEHTKLIYPDDLSILSLRRDLRAKIAELEDRQNVAPDEIAARAMAAD